MTTKLQELINSAQELSPLEQVELIRAVSQFLYQNYQQAFVATDFWQPPSLEEIVQSQSPPVIQDIATLLADFWPADETADDFTDYIYRQRQEDSLLEQ
ncbi:MAG: hypothetical protein D6784_18285 [Chloroflexi bacterium]|nr:MAG: hypothetical protein D6784_18285 [Chloroflexota bacterium]